ncbi:MAG: hypothetical protein WBS19_03520 [Candidatus Korobacteraceae bacterium]
MSAQIQVVDEAVPRYAAPTDCYRIFSEEMDSLYYLAFLLTADQNIAERCFVGGLGECVDRFSVLLDKTRSWARSAIVRSAIRIIRPVPKGDSYLVDADLPATEGVSNPFGFIVSLPVFERFVFVMSILEGQSDEHCQSLLSCSRQEVVMARKTALKRFGAGSHRFEFDQKELSIWPRFLN